MNSRDFYYGVKPDMQYVDFETFNKFIKEYPRKLEKDVCGICDPPSITYNDFILADRWPYSAVANTWAYSDDPNDYYYEPVEKRKYRIMKNYAEVFESRTGNKTEN